MNEESSPQSGQKTFFLRLTKQELEHVRDMFSILLPLEMKDTVSQRLATLKGRGLIEAKLWQKIVKACSDASLPLDDDAPDFIVMAVSTPPIGVFELSKDEQANSDDDKQGNDIFDQEDT